MFTAPTIYKNEIQVPDNKSHWIGFTLVADGIKCNRSGVGSQVIVKYLDKNKTNVSQMKEMQVVDGLSAQNDRRLHFGVGEHTGTVDVDVKWCGQRIQTFPSLPIDHYHSLVMQ